MIQTRPIATPRLSPVASDVDVVVIGAGAAGIGAALRCIARGLSCAVLEARSRVGGRALTVSLGGHAIDLGAHWLHAGAMNPLVSRGLEKGEPLRRAPQSNQVFIEGRRATRAERKSYDGAFQAAARALDGVSDRTDDASIASLLPPLGRWREPIAATLALISGRPIEEVSAKDFPSEEFGDNWFVRGGYGAYLARLAEGLPIALDTPVRAIDWSGPGVRVETDKGRITGRVAIVTVPVAVLATGGIRFTPALPVPHAETIAAFLPGTYEHVIVNWPDAPFRSADRLVKLISEGGSLGFLSRIDGSPIHYCELDHATIAETGQGGAAAFARERLSAVFGAGATESLRVLGVTDWVGDPWARAAWAVAKPGRAGDRATLAESVGRRLWFPSEATSRQLWGTVGGAWLEGEAAVDDATADRRI